MKKTKYLLLIMLLALIALIFMPNTSNAEVSAERILLTNDGSMKFNFSGLTLDTTHEYQFGFEKTSTAEITNWYNITDFTATTATVNITTNAKHLAVFDAGNTGYITINDKTTNTIIVKAYAVDLKLPYLNITNYDKAITNGYDLNNNNIKVGIRNANNSKAYYQYEKITDQTIINKYKEIKKSNGSIKELQDVIKNSAPTNSNWTQWGYFNGYSGHGGGYGYTQRNVSVPNEGLYYMWLYFQGTNIKDVYGCIIVDNLTDEIALTSISLPSTKEVELGKTLTLTPTFNPSNTTDKTVTWTSSDESVATINNSGVITPKKVGSTIITVTSNQGKKTAKCTVTVKNSSGNTDKVAIVSISLPTTEKVELGKTITLTPTFNPSNATDKSVTWASSDDSVATVNNSGVVTPKKIGTVVITVTSNDGKMQAKCTVSVEKSSGTSTPTDTTITPDKKLPQTGEKIAIIGTIGIVAVVAVVLGIKAKKYNF